MKLGIMQPYFMPYIGYFQLINAVDKYVIYDDVNYIKAGWINRNRILINNEIKYFNINLKKASQNKLINEIEILNDEKSLLKEIKKIEYNYKKAPFYKEAFELLSNVMLSQKENLGEFNENAIKSICSYLSINTQIITSSSIRKDNNLKGEDKIIHICNILKADEYYNAIGGVDLYHEDKFKNKNINLKFIKTNNIQYKQFTNKFANNLSILDVIMFNSKEKIKEYLLDYEIV